MYKYIKKEASENERSFTRQLIFLIRKADSRPKKEKARA